MGLPYTLELSLVKRRKKEGNKRMNGIRGATRESSNFALHCSDLYCMECNALSFHGQQPEASNRQHSIHIRTITSQYLLSDLLNWFKLVMVRLIPSWLVWTEIKCKVHFAPNQFKPVQQSRQQELRAYCPNSYALEQMKTKSFLLSLVTIIQLIGSTSLLGRKIKQCQG